MLTLTSLSSASRSAAMRSSTGATAWHGPHHSAQKSTRTGLSLWMTSCSKVSVVTFNAMCPFASMVLASSSTQTSNAGKPFPRIDRMFAPLPDKPDHDALEREVLDRWEREETFRRLREQNAEGPRFSFVDGPV